MAVLARSFTGSVFKSSNLFKGVISRNISLSSYMQISNKIGTQQKAAAQSSTTTSSYKSSNKKKSGNAMPDGGWILLVIPVSTLALGIWQVCRWRWKLGLIEQMRIKSIADPIPLPEETQELQGLEYRKVKVRGEFDYSNEILMGPRSLVHYDDRFDEKGRGLFSSGSGNNGYHVVTPFKLEGRNESILVNRGWINARNPSKFKHVEGPVEIVGILRKNENRAPFVSKHKPGQKVLFYRDLETMSQLLNTEEIFVDLYSIEGADFSNARADSIPIPRQTRVTLRNEHVSYFVTWFSLSAITSFMWHRRFIRRLNLL